MFRWADYEMIAKPQSVYAKIFGVPPEYEFRKATYRGGSGRRLHHIEGLTREEALHFLMHDAHGRSFARERGEPLDVLADHLVEASKRPSENAVTNKRNSNEAINMSDHLVEVCKSVVSGDVEPPSEHELVAEIKKLANASRRPGETSAAAFTRLYTSQDDDGLVLRKAVQLCKRANGFPV
jgi:hypothetical protein